MFFIRQGSTEKVVIGIAIAVGDGFTPVTNFDITASDTAYAILHDNATAIDISGYTWAAIANASGQYHLTLQSSISNTVGHMRVTITDDSLSLPLQGDFVVLDTAAYDAMYKDGAEGPLQATTVGRKLDVSAGGEAGLDWANVGSKTTTVGLTNTTVGVTTVNSDMRGTNSALLASTFTTMFSGITELAQWLSAMAGKQASDGTAQSEMRAKGGGSGTYDATTDSNEALRDTAPMGSTMVGTNSAALANVLGALGDAAAADEVTSSDTLMKYVKQLINILIGAPGVVTLKAAAAPASGVSLSEMIRAIYDDSNELQGDWTDTGRLDAILDAIKAQTDDQPAGIPKNVALSNFAFFMVDATDLKTPETGLTVTAQISKDGGAFAGVSDTVEEIGNGFYKVDFAQGEMNATVIALRFTATGAAQTTMTILTSA